MSLQAEIFSMAEIVDKAEKIYEDKYRQSYETEHAGQYAVIDVTDGAIYLGEYAEIALEKASNRSPDGLFHLIRIGAPSAFNLGFLGSQQFNISTGEV